MAPEMGFAALTLHGKGRVMGTAGDPVFIQSIAIAVESEFGFERDKRLLKLEVFEKRFINGDGIKCGISKKSFRVDQRMFLQKILQGRQERFRICQGFILIGGDLDFFPTSSSGWLSR